MHDPTATTLPESCHSPAEGGTPGRPKDMEKHGAILRAARMHFLSHGFDRASMDGIATEAGVSKLTVYSHFGCKEALFKHVIEGECHRHAMSSDFMPLLEMPVERALADVAARFVHLILQPDVISMHRIMVAEAIEKPTISRLFYEAGPERVMQGFAAYLTALHERGELRVEEPLRAAAHFFQLLKGEPYFRALLNLEPAGPAELAAHQRDAVALFLRAYTPAAQAG